MINDHPPTFNALLKGVSHRPIEVKVIVKDMADGTNLMVERDHANQFDKNAIRVLHPVSDEHLGYVAKEVAEEMAPWMDQGWHFTCIVDGRANTYMLWLKLEPILPEDVDERELKNAPLLDYLFEAMLYEHGIVIDCDNPIKLREKLYFEQRKLPELSPLSFYLSPTNPRELWVVKGLKNGKEK